MPAPRHRSRSLRRVFVKTASRVLTRYRKRKPSKAKCPDCGRPLSGTVNLRASKLKTIPKSKKSPSRKYGNLCSQCSRKKLIQKARDIKW